MDIKTILEICIFITIVLLIIAVVGTACYEIMTYKTSRPTDIREDVWEALGEYYERQERDERAYRKVAKAKKKEYKHAAKINKIDFHNQ